MMRAVVGDGVGNAFVTERQIPTPREDEVLMKVSAVGVNRADLLQIVGRYPPPKGTTDVLGLEAAGRLQNGELVSALLTGGGFAEYVAVPKSAILRFPHPAPNSLSSSQLAAIPEAFLAAYHIIFQKGALSENETVLINAAGSGVGTCAIQLAATIPNVKIIACAGSDAKLEVCKNLGAHHTINYHSQGISDTAMKATDGRGVDLVLDCVGATQFKEIARSLSHGGRWVMYGLLSGPKSPEISLAGIVSKHLTVTGTTMRSRSLQDRANIVSSFLEQFGDQVGEQGSLKPVIHKVFRGLDSAPEAFEYMRNNRNTGKLIVSLEQHS